MICILSVGYNCVAIRSQSGGLQTLHPRSRLDTDTCLSGTSSHSDIRPPCDAHAMCLGRTVSRPIVHLQCRASRYSGMWLVQHRSAYAHWTRHHHPGLVQEITTYPRCRTRCTKSQCWSSAAAIGSTRRGPVQVSRIPFVARVVCGDRAKRDDSSPARCAFPSQALSGVDLASVSTVYELLRAL